MANKNTVTATFAGDSRDLEKAIGDVGSAAAGLQGDFDKAEGAGDDLKTSFDKVGKAARELDTDIATVKVDGLSSRMVSAAAAGDVAERSFIGVADVLGVMGDRFGLPVEGASELVRQFADLGGAAGALLPLINAQTLAWLASNAAMLLSVGLFLALGVGIALLIVHWDSIVEKVPALGVALGGLTGAFTAAKDGVTGVVDWIGGQFDRAIGFVQNLPYRVWTASQGLWNPIWEPLVGIVSWLTDRWNGIVEEVQGLPGRLAAAGAAVWDWIKSGFASALNAAIAAWNGFSFLGVDTPDIPFVTLHRGGRVPGGPTSETLTLLRGGERVLRPAEAAPGAAVVINVSSLDPAGAARAVVEAIDEYERRNGRRFARA